MRDAAARPSERQRNREGAADRMLHRAGAPECIPNAAASSALPPFNDRNEDEDPSMYDVFKDVEFCGKSGSQLTHGRISPFPVLNLLL